MAPPQLQRSWTIPPQRRTSQKFLLRRVRNQLVRVRTVAAATASAQSTTGWSDPCGKSSSLPLTTISISNQCASRTGFVVFALIEEPLWESGHPVQPQAFCPQLPDSCTLRASLKHGALQGFCCVASAALCWGGPSGPVPPVWDALRVFIRRVLCAPVALLLLWHSAGGRGGTAVNNTVGAFSTLPVATFSFPFPPCQSQGDALGKAAVQDPQGVVK